MTLALAATTAQAATPAANAAATRRHFDSLMAGSQPKLAELTMFMTRMPKGGDLHHHYSGAIYAERYVDWLDKQGYCVYKSNYRIETDKAVVAIQHAAPLSEKSCLSGAELLADDYTYRELLQRWSSKDFDNHGAVQPPPDRQFFETFLYFNAVSNTNFQEGLQEIKQRAIAENVGYIETMFKMAPLLSNADFDRAVAGADDATLQAQLQSMHATLEQDGAFNKRIADFADNMTAVSAGIDDARFTMRYQTYVLRLLAPSQVFSSMVAGFKAASLNPLLVGVNIVGAENNYVSMRDYQLHMKMFQYLKSKYPKVKVALHAGELALGMVPPEGLQFHIDSAVSIGGAARIGHGMDLAHEANAPAILKTMREKDIAVEINLTSNDFILGIKGQAHPVTLYRKYGVPFVLSTDDAGVSRNNLANEYVLFATRYGATYAELKQISYNAIRYSFADSATKETLRRQLDARYLQFEADTAALAARVTRR